MCKRTIEHVRGPDRPVRPCCGVVGRECGARRRAHPSFAMFDTQTTVTLTGTVTAFEWTNPHAYIELDVIEDGDSVRHWTIELGRPLKVFHFFCCVRPTYVHERVSERDPPDNSERIISNVQ